ncbi:Dicer-like protein 1 [Mortierella claussenii]|nr:Dicer-like protein 1 [Mortierella claussenii]
MTAAAVPPQSALSKAEVSAGTSPSKGLSSTSGDILSLVDSDQQELTASLRMPARLVSTTTEVVVPEVPVDPYLVPRTYQIELFRKALRKNIIAVMDTGSGKTLVAVMLIKAMIEREQAAQRMEHEQAGVIRANSSCNVMELCGQKQNKKYSADLWSQAYQNADVVVLTAQILLDLLRHATIKMSRVHLLVFDECHHARGNDPFAAIMTEFYHRTLKEDRPKVFGMTASPSLDAGSRLQHSAKKLEVVLDSRIFTVDQDQIQAVVERPMEIIVQYHPAPKYNSTQLTLTLREQCSMANKLDQTNASVEHHLQHLGPWCVDRLWRINVESLADVKDLAAISDDVKMAANIIRSRMPTKPVTSDAYLSPKVLKLLQLLKVATDAWDEEFCGIVFVERRETAIALCLLLQEMEEFQDCLRVQVLAGHNDDCDQRVLRMSYREQNTIITLFKNKTYNLLVATSVAEEGLDIQPCNFVVRFDPVTTIISYIQSRGRARKKNSRYIVMQELDNRSEEASFEKLKYYDHTLKVWCKSLDDERLMSNPAEVDADISVDPLTPPQMYEIESTGALLTLDSAVALVHTYCNTLAGDEFCSLRPDFNIMPNGTSGFICNLTLPPNAPLRTVQSDRASTKNMAKKSAAFKACQKLHVMGALNDNLWPIMTDILNDEDMEEFRAVDNREKTKSYPVASPAFWRLKPIRTEASTLLYGCVIELDDRDLDRLGGKDRYRTQCLLTYHPIPCSITPFNLYVEGAARLVKMRTVSSPVYVDNTQLESLRQFTLTLFRRMCHKTFECPQEEMPYFVAPLIRDYSESIVDFGRNISWEDVAFGKSIEYYPLQEGGVDDQSILSNVMTLRHDHGRDFFVRTVLRDVRMQDVMPASFSNEHAAWDEAIAKGKIPAPPPSSPSSLTPRTEERSDRTFARFFKWKYNVDCPENDVIVKVERVRKMRNHLQPAYLEEEKRYESMLTILPLSACERCSVRADVLRMSQMVPSILYSLDSTLLVQEIREKVGLGPIRLDSLQQAFTSSSANRDFQYERLELLGDSFLKFSSTIRLYIVNPAKDEGQLHKNRIRIISNKALLKHATDLELYRYVSSTPFHRKSWKPTRFIVDGKSWKDDQQHVLSNKTLADIIEATLGAGYLSGGVKLGFLAAKALHVSFDEFKDWDDLSTVYTQLQAARESKELATATTTDERWRFSLTKAHLTTVREVSETIGYEFKNPVLLVEAMTHASHIRADAMCYQRLEFLGDAVLDFQVIRYYYEKYWNAPPGAITLIKDASVNNQILGALCIKWGLQRHLNHYSPALPNAIAAAVTALEARQEQSATGELEGEYWIDVLMPKVLGDLVESTLGAVFVDSGFNFEVVRALFERMIRPFLDKHVNFDRIVIHASKALLEDLQAKGCNNFKFVHENEDKGRPLDNNSKQGYIPLLRKLGLGPRVDLGLPMTTTHLGGGSKSRDENEAPLKCHFQIHGQTIATVTGDHIEQLRKEVALKTMKILQSDPTLLTNLCTCPKRRGTRQLSMLDKYLQ